MLLKNCIAQLTRGEHLSENLCQQVVEEILDPTMNPLQIAAFLALLRAKRETTQELVAIVKVLRAKMIVVPTYSDVIDIVGTGGDGFNTVNISTGSAILAASCGVKVAKHGNRAVSSATGSADVLEALGVNIELSAQQISKSIEAIGIGFCYSPNFHPLTQAFKTFRKQFNIPTTFNLLGPLLNPANAAHLVLGVADKALLPMMADVLIAMKTKRSVIVHGNGLDEISCVGPSQLLEINGEQKTLFNLESLDYGLQRCTVRDLQGGDSTLNAELLLAALQGHRGPIADTLILNAAVALYIAGKHFSMNECVQHATDNLYSGAANSLLTKWIEFSNE